MTAIAITGMGLTGVLRMTWVQDSLAHVLDHSQADETSGTWTGLACPSHGLPLGTDVDNTTLRHLAVGGEIADLTWEAPDDLTADHSEVFLAAMHAHHAGDTKRADQLWENLQAIWSQAWSANYAALEFMQGTGLARFSPVKPQHWVVASFEHHTSPHGLPRPHIHNIAIPSLTTGANMRKPGCSGTLRVVGAEGLVRSSGGPRARRGSLSLSKACRFQLSGDGMRDVLGPF